MGAVHRILQEVQLWAVLEVQTLGAWERAPPSPLPRFFKKNRVKLFLLPPFLRDGHASAVLYVYAESKRPGG